METIYEVSFIWKDKYFRIPVKTDSKSDAIAYAKEIAPDGEEFRVRLWCIDGVCVNGVWGGAEDA
jgi:hypothetical protein